MNIYDQLRRDEGDRATAYQDSRGVWTVGVGHNLAVPISYDARDLILHDDVQSIETELLQLPIWGRLSDARRGVLLNMGFNLGFAGLMQFRQFYTALESGNWEAAGDALRDSRWAKQVGARADRLERQVVEDAWV